MGDYDASDLYQDSLTAEEELKHALREISEGSVAEYLGTYGDAVEARVRFCLQQAEQLRSDGHWGPSVTVSVTAIELAIRFLLVRPLVQGAFLSDEWADVLASRIAKGRAADDRNLLPAILRKWGIEITERSLPSGEPLWQTMREEVWPKRNDHVHKASPVEEQDAVTALQCAESFVELVWEMAGRLGFTLTTTGKWCEIVQQQRTRRYQRESPF